MHPGLVQNKSLTHFGRHFEIRLSLLASADIAAKRETGVAEMKSRSRMDLNSIKRTILGGLGVLALSSVNALAQEIRSDISLQSTGLFTKDAGGNGIRQHATDTGGFLVGWKLHPLL